MRTHHLLIFYWLPVCTYCVLIFIQSSFPASQSIPDLPLMDKLLHFMAYALLGALMLRALRHHLPDHRFALGMMLSIILSILYGISDEFHQAFVPARRADIADLLANALGSMCGVFFYRYVLDRYYASYPYGSGRDKIARYI